MDTRTVDVAIIGAGTAGLATRREAAKLGATVVLIEGGSYGTTCARVGCMPSKLLIAAADAAHHVAVAGRFGIRVPQGVRVDGRAVLERVRHERDRFVGFVLESVEAIPAEQRLRGRARFTGPTTLVVDDHTRVEAKAVVMPPARARAAERRHLRALRFARLARRRRHRRRRPRTRASLAPAGRADVLSHSERLGPLTDPAVQAAAAEDGWVAFVWVEVNPE